MEVERGGRECKLVGRESACVVGSGGESSGIIIERRSPGEGGLV